MRSSGTCLGTRIKEKIFFFSFFYYPARLYTDTTPTLVSRGQTFGVGGRRSGQYRQVCVNKWHAK